RRDQRFRSLAQLHLRGIEYGELRVGGQVVLRRDQFLHPQSRNVPPVASSDLLDFFLGFRERDIEATLTPLYPFQQELHRESGLARSRRPGDEMQAVLRIAAAQNIVKTAHARRRSRIYTLSHIRSWSSAGGRAEVDDL